MPLCKKEVWDFIRVPPSEAVQLVGGPPPSFNLSFHSGSFWCDSLPDPH